VVVTALVSVMLLLSACFPTGQGGVQRALNADRQAHGRSSLSIHQQANNKAQAWAEHLARQNRLSHSTLSHGITVRWCGLAENVGYGSSIQAVQNSYMNSPSHRANILDSKWNGVGVGTATNGSRVFTVQVFIQTC
jgi:uncharacterized protein YkwD